MQLLVRLYRRHDSDLIYLRSYGVNISAFFRLCLKNYAEGNHIMYSLPIDKHEQVLNKDTMQVHFRIKDPKVEALLASIPSGFRSSFCKSVVRSSLRFTSIRYCAPSSVVSDKEKQLAASVDVVSLTDDVFNKPVTKEEVQKIKETILKKATPSGAEDNPDPVMSEVKPSAPKSSEKKKKKNFQPSFNDAPVAATPSTASHTEDALGVEDPNSDPMDDNVFGDLFAELAQNQPAPEPQRKKVSTTELLGMFGNLMDQ